MAWITPEDVEAVYPFATTLTETQCAHIQGLCEAVIGHQDEPVTNRVKAVVVDIAVRFWRGVQGATASPAGYQSERIDDYQYDYPAAGPILTGFGLTQLEKKSLRRAARIPEVGVMKLTRGPLETSGVDNLPYGDTESCDTP